MEESRRNENKENQSVHVRRERLEIGLCSLSHEDVRMCYGAMFVMAALPTIARLAPLQRVSCSVSKHCQTRLFPDWRN